MPRNEPVGSDPTGRFADRAADYARHRPGYPPAAIDAVLAGLGPPAGLVAADVGAGTGISARLLAERGVRVLAIEPNGPMRAAAAAHPRVEWRDATAETTGLADGSADLVLAAQAFHWFRAAEALAEFHRVLRPGGRAALLWNDRGAEDAFSRGYYELVLSTPEGQRVSAGWGVEDPFAGRPGWADARALTFEGGQVLDEAGVLGRAMSASYVPKAGAEHERIMDALRALVRRHADERGCVRLVYRTRLFLAERAEGCAG
jgi:SAM-dependent methyltransferase